MRARPGFALVAAAVLGLGIGTSTAVFSVLYQVLLKPLAYPDSGQLLNLHNALPKSQVDEAGVSGFDYTQIGARRDVFARAGVYYYNDLTLTGFGPARHLDVVNASASLFDVLAVPPRLGRVFSPAEDRPSAAKTAVLSEPFWRAAFAADPGVVGRVIHLNGFPYTVLGVMPQAFAFPSRETQMWIPTALPASASSVEGGRSEKWLHMIARLAPGVTIEQSRSALRNLSQGLARHFPALYPEKDGWRFTARPLAEEQTSGIRRWLYLAFAAVLSVLLIACINVSGLLLIRATVRTSEVALRLAMGASRGRILQQILTETGCLVVFGCVLGGVLAVCMLTAINRFGPLGQPVVMQSWTLVFGIALALISTLAAGLVPALWSARRPLEQTLKRGSRTAPAGGMGRDAVVAAQIALAVVLTFTAAELSRSFVALTRVPAGFDASRVWSGSVEVPGSAYGRDQRWNTQFFEPALAQLGAIPGVEAVSGTNALPFNPSGVWAERLHLTPEKDALHPEAQIGLTLPGYFETMRIPLLAGRTFTAADRTGAPLVAVVDEELARRYFANENPVGQWIASGGMENPAQIIGVVGGVHNGSLDSDRKPEVYFPELQKRSEAMYFVVRTQTDIDVTDAVRRAIAGIDPAVALFDVAPMRDRIADSLNMRRFIAFLLSTFALAGMLLAAVGLYSSLAHLVVIRRREIGIRVALGAMQSRIVGLIVGRGALVIAGGIACGIGGSLAAGHLIRSQIYGIETAATVSWMIVFGAALSISAVALWFPARSAARIDPSTALREE